MKKQYQKQRFLKLTHDQPGKGKQPTLKELRELKLPFVSFRDIAIVHLGCISYAFRGVLRSRSWLNLGLRARNPASSRFFRCRPSAKALRDWLPMARTVEFLASTCCFTYNRLPRTLGRPKKCLKHAETMLKPSNFIRFPHVPLRFLQVLQANRRLRPRQA